MAQEGFEPSASLVLSESGLPVAYRARCNPVPGAGIEPAASTFRAWRHYQQQLPRSRRFGKEDSNLHRLIQSQGACRLADSRERPAGVEPACRTWEARCRRKPGVVPLDQSRVTIVPNPSSGRRGS